MSFLCKLFTGSYYRVYFRDKERQDEMLSSLGCLMKRLEQLLCLLRKIKISNGTITSQRKEPGKWVLDVPED